MYAWAARPCTPMYAMSLHPSLELGKQNCVGQSLAKQGRNAGYQARICSDFELTVEGEGEVDFFLTMKPVGARLRG